MIASKIKIIFSKLNTRECLYHFILFVVLLLIDQLSKVWAQIYLEDAGRTIPVLAPYFQLSFLRNYVPGWYSYVFYLVFNLVLLPAMWYYYLTQEESPFSIKLGLTLVYVGLFGNNLIDAFWFGYIRDFIYLSKFGTGNVADQIKYVGVILTIFGALRMEGYLKTPKQIIVAVIVIVGIFLLIMRYFYGIIQI